ncbi:helix-turn-helix domain-containing protein [Candidatus Galacturonibacter soehngenii]|uniref:Helix-turn-helix domain-containing protein n=1 Tax=Candidatus Galacturonatibacter soehngenii TaxID=2307010 RepID=A0A7V7UB01_9FIRM|nr:helix-turn-helix domain-containing protein [Candidatus Galacturonibacter soehngenii]KAB1437583.1 helix-turn-helix domain-containing protein [Candidatus Galacturonibacter soehngenii]
MSFYTVEDVKKILGISDSKAYQIIRKLNKELSNKGYITVAGRIPKKFFNERYYCDESELKAIVGN